MNEFDRPSRTRCSAIAERPSCRMRYRFRQK